MASAKAVLGALVGRLLFREVEVTAIRDVGPRFRLVDVSGTALHGVDWTPGDKIQVYLPGEGMRTYTPMRWDANEGTSRLLLYVHGTPAQTPGAAWAERLRAGDRFSFFGPRASIAFPDLGRTVVFVGDETSFAAACALHDANAAAKSVFEVDDEAASNATLREIGLTGAITVERKKDDGHLDDLVARVASELDREASASVRLALTGRAQTIQSLRSRLKSRGLLRQGKVKAYWSVGKAGLD
jgi:ferric-chelate reductase (NADPH)